MTTVATMTPSAWLATALADGARPAAELLTSAPFTPKQLRAARARLGVVVAKGRGLGKASGWVWTLPAQGALTGAQGALPQGALQGSQGALVGSQDALAQGADTSTTWTVVLGDGTKLTSVQPGGATRNEMEQTIREVFGHRGLLSLSPANQLR